MESRDLWEYELALSPAQVDRLVCMPGRRAPRLRLLLLHPQLFVPAAVAAGDRRPVAAPARAIRRLGHPVRHRAGGAGPARAGAASAAPAAILTVMSRRKAKLSSTEVRAWRAIRDRGGAQRPLPVEALAAVPEAAPGDDPGRRLRLLPLPPGAGRRADAFKQKERPLLLARGRLGLPAARDERAPAIDAPERGHATFRLSLGARHVRSGGRVPDPGGAGRHPRLSGPARAAIRETPSWRWGTWAALHRWPARLSLDRLDLIDIVSASPIDRWVKSLSWKVWLGVDNARELGCERADSDRQGWRCLYAGVITGGGGAARFGPEGRLMAFALVETDAGVGPAFRTGKDIAWAAVSRRAWWQRRASAGDSSWGPVRFSTSWATPGRTGAPR